MPLLLPNGRSRVLPRRLCHWPLDASPVTPGHALLVPNPTHPYVVRASVEEQTALMRAVEVARQTIESNHGADGYNIGINNGEAAGQTVFHLHVHIIARRHGDVPDRRG